MGISRADALELMKKYIKSDYLTKHSMASGLIMERLAERFKENKDQWYIAGILHDIDYELVNEDPKRHGLEAERILSENGIDERYIEAIKAHNGENLGIERTTLLSHVLAASETSTGLIFASALMMPDKRISSIKDKSLKKKFKSKSFAAKVNRDTIKEIEKADIELYEFLSIALEVMKQNESILTGNLHED
ncbi:MAG: HD domain-containing protein [Epsilonproteobacteria bacterium]|nr:HD domain-containing protein [Campylobacterota bacterium]